MAYVGWTDAEVRALIGFWGDSRIQAESDGAVRNKAIYEKIARKMAEAGFIEIGNSAEQRSRISRMLQEKWSRAPGDAVFSSARCNPSST